MKPPSRTLTTLAVSVLSLDALLLTYGGIAWSRPLLTVAGGACALGSVLVVMGRRLIEAGARFVTVLWDTVDGYSWDSHLHSRDVEKHLLPGLDQAFSALLEDLADLDVARREMRREVESIRELLHSHRLDN